MSEYTIYGNYDTQELDKFPLDCEGMATMQDNIKLLTAMALLSGVDKLILTGCTVSGSQRTAGYVYVRTGSNLIGEILYHPAQNNSTTCYIKEENISITANNETFSNAYIKRYLADGTGTSSMNWSSFANVSDIGNNALKNAINAEVSARTNAINAEVSARTNAINAEVDNRNTVISTAIATEATARTNADNALSARVSTLEGKHLYQHNIFLIGDNLQCSFTLVSLFSTPFYDFDDLHHATYNKELSATGYYYDLMIFKIKLENGSNIVVWTDNGHEVVYNVDIEDANVIQIY